MNKYVGYGIHIRALREKDLEEWAIKLPSEVPLDDCILIEGEDLGRAPAAIVQLTDDGAYVIWQDNQITVMRDSNIEENFSIGVQTLLQEVHPHV